MVSEDRRWKEKPGMSKFYRAYSLTCMSRGHANFKIGTKQSVYIREEHDATMQPRFDRCVFQNLNFPVFDKTENCQFHIFRLLVKRQLSCSNIHFHK